MRVALTILALGLAAGCGGPSLKLAGEECTASSECADGLQCDFGSTPPVCATDNTLPDGAVAQPDAPPGTPDAGLPDADTSLPDAATTIDAPPIDAPPIDAPVIDAPPVIIDAPPDA